MNEVTCPKCNEQYTSIGQHWTRAKNCSHPNLTAHQMDVATGLILGDGTLTRNYKNSVLQVKMTNKKYLEHLSDIFGVMSLNIELHKTGSEQAEMNRNSGFHTDAKDENYSDVYRWMTRAHPQLNTFRSWYQTGEKVFPDKLLISPTLLKHWYVCDGDRQNNRIRIASGNETERLDKLAGYFDYVDIPKPKTTGHRIYWSAEDSKEVADYMGEPLPGFGYKWPPKSLNG